MAYVQDVDAHAKVINHVPFQKYPRLLYPERGGFPIKVNGESEEAERLRNGYLTTVPKGYVDDGSGFYRPHAEVEADVDQSMGESLKDIKKLLTPKEKTK